MVLSKETIEGMNKRIRTSNPMWTLVGGPDLEHLNGYREKISLLVFTDVFYKELNDDNKRTKEDLIQIAYNVIKLMDLKPTRPLAEKVIDSLMWSEGKNFARFSFIARTFNEETNEWEEQRFQYFTLDRKYTDLENQIEVFKLTEESQEIVIKSQELMDEFDITVQGIISEILIKREKYKEALSTLQNLDTKVRRLIQKEEEHKKQILKDPKGAIYIEYKKWGETLEEVRQQFQEELARYDEMERILKSKFERDPHNPNITQLFYRIGVTRREHDKLAGLVIGNIQKEFNFRSDPKLFTLLWDPPKTSFKNTVMDGQVIPNGLQKPEDAFKMMNILFSPQKKFIYPIQWMIKEQGYRDRIIDFDDDDSMGGDDWEAETLDVDWDEMVELWTPVMIELLNKGSVTNLFLLTLPEPHIQRWIECREAMDMWIIFLMREKEFTLPERMPDKTNDQKIGLIKRLAENNVDLKHLFGLKLKTKTLNQKIITIEKEVRIPPISIELIS